MCIFESKCICNGFNVNTISPIVRQAGKMILMEGFVATRSWAEAPENLSESWEIKGEKPSCLFCAFLHLETLKTCEIPASLML